MACKESSEFGSGSIFGMRFTTLLNRELIWIRIRNTVKNIFKNNRTIRKTLRKSKLGLNAIS